MRGVHHVEFSVLDYDRSIAFYDKMFGWLGYKSFWTLDIGYRSTYYMSGMPPFLHSYIGIQPARSGEKLAHEDRATGIHHIALWAKSRKQVDAFYREFLLENDVAVTEAPAEYTVYAPGYYAVFFDDPFTGIHWELAHTPLWPSISSYFRWVKALRAAYREMHPGDEGDAMKKAFRVLPRRGGRS